MELTADGASVCARAGADLLTVGLVGASTERAARRCSVAAGAAAASAAREWVSRSGAGAAGAACAANPRRPRMRDRLTLRRRAPRLREVSEADALRLRLRDDTAVRLSARAEAACALICAWEAAAAVFLWTWLDDAAKVEPEPATKTANATTRTAIRISNGVRRIVSTFSVGRIESEIEYLIGFGFV